MSAVRALLLFACLLVAQPSQAQRESAIDTLSQQIAQAAAAGRNEEGLAFARKLEGLVKRQQGTRNMNYAGTLHNQGMFLHNLGRFPEAAEKLGAALAIKLKNNNPASVLRTSNILADTYKALGRNAEASSVAQRALSIGTDAFGPDDPGLSGTLAALGGLAVENEEYNEAEAYYKRALAIQQKSGKSDPIDVAAAMGHLGDLHGLQGRFDEGERLLQQSLDLLDQTLGPDATNSPNFHKIFKNLGNLYKDAGRFSEAEVAFRRSLSISRSKFGNDHPSVAAAMGELASTLYVSSRFAEAETLNKQSLVIYEKVFGPQSQNIAIVLSNLASEYTGQKRADEAIGLLQRALSIEEKLSGPDSPSVARTLTNLANSYKSAGRGPEAVPLYEKALRILTKRFGEDSLQIAPALGNMGRVAQNNNNPVEAERYFSRALQIDETTFGPEHPTLVNDLRALALLDIELQKYPEARLGLQRALRIAEARLGPRHGITLAAMVNLASVYAKEGNWPEALGILRRASATTVASVDPDPASVALSIEVNAALVEAIWRVTEPRPDDASTAEAFSAIQRAHDTQAGRALAQMAARFGAGSDAMALVVRRQQDLKVTRDSLDKRITTELGVTDGKRNDALIASLRAESSRAQKALEEATAQIGRDFPGYVELASPSPLSIEGTQALLEPDEVLVSFLSVDSRSFMFAVTREGRAWQQTPLGHRAMADRVSKLRAGLVDAMPGVDSKPIPFDLEASHELYSALIGPIATLMSNKPKLLVVPSGALTSLPFHVLVTRKPDPGLNADERFRQAAWLLNDKAITVLPSIGSLRGLRSFAKASRADRPFIGFGDPLFQRPGSEKKTGQRGVQPYQTYYKGTVVDIDALRRGLAALPETADELRAVARELGASENDVKLGASATVPGVQAAGLARYRVVEFATHGLVAGEVGGLSEPALVLSLPDHPTSEDDGLLTASRVAKLQLDADWAVLSACNTAAGNKPGAEGLSGLARAFFYAGARALLVSHWPVNSDAAVKLTTGAFAELKRNPTIGRAEAFRRSMQALIADRSSPDNANPSVWAPFVLVGEGGAG